MSFSMNNDTPLQTKSEPLPAAGGDHHKKKLDSKPSFSKTKSMWEVTKEERQAA